MNDLASSTGPRKARVLIVEDDAQLLRLCAKVVQQQHEIALAASTSEAIDVAGGFRPHVLITDYNLPDGNGVQLAASLSRSRAGLRVLLITGALPDEVELKALPEKATLLHKPFAPHQLLQAIRELLADATSGDVQAEQINEAQTDTRAMEHRYRQIVESASDIIYETDANGYFRYANPVGVEAVGYPLVELLSMRFTELIREDKRLEAEKFYGRQARDRTRTTYYEYPVVRPDGRTIWLGQNVQLLTRGTEIVGFQAVARDITQRHQTDQFKDELLAVVGHELRTPLTTIRGALGLLKSGKLPAQQAERMLSIAVDDAERMSRLIEDFLDLERIRFGQLDINRTETAIADLITRAAAAVEVTAGAAGVPIEIVSAPGSVLVDTDRMLQVLINLLTNAIKFSEKGSPVTLRAEQDSDETRLSVQDRGVGIADKDVELIYEPFRQLDQTDTRQRGGLGVGLSIAQSIVQLHGGRLALASEVGRGSTFTIHLPNQ